MTSCAYLMCHWFYFNCFLLAHKVAKLPQVQRLSRELLLDILFAVADDMPESRLPPEFSACSLSDSSGYA